MTGGGFVFEQQRHSPVTERKEAADIGARIVHLPFHDLAQVLARKELIIDVFKARHQLQHRGLVFDKARVFKD